MFDETEPVAAIFVGGMRGISDEYELLGGRQPPPGLYPIARPGGEAARLAPNGSLSVATLLANGDVYPTVCRAIVDDIAERFGRL